MDDYSSVYRAYMALLEKMILDAGLRLPDVYEGLYGKELKSHEERVSKIRYPLKSQSKK